MEQSKEVSSSTISHVAYNDETNELRVTFKHGGTYLYKGVNPETHKALIEAPSVGKHFLAHIRPQYEGVKQAPPVEEPVAS